MAVATRPRGPARGLARGRLRAARGAAAARGATERPRHAPSARRGAAPRAPPRRGPSGSERRRSCVHDSTNSRRPRACPAPAPCARKRAASRHVRETARFGGRRPVRRRPSSATRHIFALPGAREALRVRASRLVVLACGRVREQVLERTCEHAQPLPRPTHAHQRPALRTQRQKLRARRLRRATTVSAHATGSPKNHQSTPPSRTNRALRSRAAGGQEGSRPLPVGLRRLWLVGVRPLRPLRERTCHQRQDAQKNTRQI